MNNKLTVDCGKLKERLKTMNILQVHISKKLDISQAMVSKKLSQESPFTPSEITIIEKMGVEIPYKEEEYTSMVSEPMEIYKVEEEKSNVDEDSINRFKEQLEIYRYNNGGINIKESAKKLRLSYTHLCNILSYKKNISINMMKYTFKYGLFNPIYTLFGEGDKFYKGTSKSEVEAIKLQNEQLKRDNQNLQELIDLMRANKNQDKTKAA
jgi:hypothetical protein